MKVVHVSTSDNGGAAVAALRIHGGLLYAGIDSSFLSLYKKDDNYPKKYQFERAGVKYDFKNRLKIKLGKPITQEKKNLRLLNGLVGNYEIFSFPFTDYKVEDCPLIRAADIIHLHWIANFINYPSFFSAVKNP